MAWQPHMEIMKQGMSLPPKTHSPGSCATTTPYAGGRHWIIWWILWRNGHSMPLGWLTRAVLGNLKPIPSLKSASPKSIPTPELLKLTDRLEHLTMMLIPVPQPSKELIHKTIHTYKDTLHTTQGESKLTATILQDIPTFDRKDSSKLDDWFIDIETAADILTESHTCLSEAKSHYLTCTLICEATQTGKCWDEIRGILRLKLCNVNIQTYTSYFMEIQQKNNETLAAYIHHFKTEAKWCTFDIDTVKIHIFVKGLWKAPVIIA